MSNILRNMLELVNGRPVLGTEYAHGLLAEQILAETATGTNGPGLMFNDGLTAGKRYRLVLADPSAITGLVLENGALAGVTAPASGSYSLFEDGVLVGSGIPFTVGAAAPAVPANTAAPTITGTAMEGQVLTASPGAWTGSPTSYTYRWIRETTPIAGATASTYTPQAADIGSHLHLGVIAANATGPSAEALSAQTAIIDPAPVSGMPTQQRTLQVPADNRTQLHPSVRQPLPISAGASLDIGWDWADWLPPGDSIVDYSIDIPAGITLSRQITAGAIVGTWATIDPGLPPSTPLLATCQITTAQGRIDRRIYTLLVALH